jgi:hypothetical protein
MPLLPLIGVFRMVRLFQHLSREEARRPFWWLGEFSGLCFATCWSLLILLWIWILSALIEWENTLLQHDCPIPENGYFATGIQTHAGELLWLLSGIFLTVGAWFFTSLLVKRRDRVS